PLTTCSYHDAYTQRDPAPFPTRRSSDLEAREVRNRDGRTARRLLGRDVWFRRDRERLAADRDKRQSQPLGDRPRKTAQRSPRSRDRKSTRLNSSHVSISYAVFCLKKKTD